MTDGASTEQLRAEINDIRADLGATVQELAARVDVPARVRSAAGQAGRQAKGRAEQAKQYASRSPVPWLALASGVAAVVAVVLVVRGRRRR